MLHLHDLELEELRHVLAHLHCALDELVRIVDPIASGASLDAVRRHLADCEAQVFLDEERTDDGAPALPQETEEAEAEAQAQGEGETEAKAEQLAQGAQAGARH